MKTIEDLRKEVTFSSSGKKTIDDLRNEVKAPPQKTRATGIGLGPMWDEPGDTRTMRERMGHEKLGSVKPVRPRWDEFVDATARGTARVGSAGAQAGASFMSVRPSPGPARALGLSGGIYSETETTATKRRMVSAKLKKNADFLWELSKNPDLAAQNKDVASKMLNLMGETIPYITATTAGYVTMGPLGGFSVGSLVEGNSSYRNAQDYFKEINKGEPLTPEQERKSVQIGIAVGVISGAVEAFGGKYAEQLALKAVARLKSKILRGGAVFGIGTVIEALEEGAQEVAAITGEETYRDVDWNERTTRTLSAMAGGGFLGGTMRGGGMATQRLFSAEEKAGIKTKLQEEGVSPKVAARAAEMLEEGWTPGEIDLHLITPSKFLGDNAIEQIQAKERPRTWEDRQQEGDVAEMDRELAAIQRGETPSIEVSKESLRKAAPPWLIKQLPEKVFAQWVSGELSDKEVVNIALSGNKEAKGAESQMEITELDDGSRQAYFEGLGKDFNISTFSHDDAMDFAIEMGLDDLSATRITAERIEARAAIQRGETPSTAPLIVAEQAPEQLSVPEGIKPPTAQPPARELRGQAPAVEVGGEAKKAATKRVDQEALVSGRLGISKATSREIAAAELETTRAKEESQEKKIKKLPKRGFDRYAVYQTNKIVTLAAKYGLNITGGRVQSGSHYLQVNHPKIKFPAANQYAWPTYKKRFTIRISNHIGKGTPSEAKFKMMPGNEKELLRQIELEMIRRKDEGEYKSEKWAQEALAQPPAKAEPATKKTIEDLREEVSDEESSGITKPERRRLIKENAAKIERSDIYQNELAGLETAAAEVGPGYYYIDKGYRGEVEAIIGKRKGFPTKTQKMFTFDPRETRIITLADGSKAEVGPTPWERAVQEGLGRGKEGVDQTWGEMDISEFVQRVVDSRLAQETVGGINKQALERAEQSGYPDEQLWAEKHRMLVEGYSDQQLNEMVTEWAEEWGIALEDVEGEYVSEYGTRIRQIKKMEDPDDALEQLATEQIEAEDRRNAVIAAQDVLEANDIVAEVEEVEDIRPVDLLGRPVLEGGAAGKQRGLSELGLEFTKPEVKDPDQMEFGQLPEEDAKLIEQASRSPYRYYSDGKQYSRKKPSYRQLQGDWYHVGNAWSPKQAKQLDEYHKRVSPPEKPLDDIPFETRGRPVGAAITQGQKQVILLAYGADSETGYHEGYHILRRRLTEKSTKVLDKYFKGDEEAEARAFAEYAKTGKTKTFLRGIWQKLRNVLRKVKSGMMGRGFKTAEDIFGAIQKGTIEKKNVTAEGGSVQYEVQPYKLEVDSLSKQQLAKINTYMKRKGYDVRGVDDVKQILNRLTNIYGKEGELRHLEWIDAVKKVKEPPKKLSDTTKVLRKFGITNNPKEAGYITKTGTMIDFSGKREGGFPGIRSYDHRQIHEAEGVAGGTEGMISFMMEGNIRVGQGSIDMYNQPTTQQKLALKKYMEAFGGEVNVEINDGKFYREYDGTTSNRKIIQDIDNYWQTGIDIRFETSGEKLRRDAEKSARIKARKARLAEKHKIKIKKVSRRRLQIKLQDHTPPLREDLVDKAPDIGPALTEEPPPGKARPPTKTVLGEKFYEQVQKKYRRTVREAVSEGIRRKMLTFDRAVGIMSSRLGRIDESLKYAVRRYAFNTHKRTTALIEAAKPMTKALKKLDKFDKRAFKFAALNGQGDKINELVDKYGIRNEYQQFRDVLDDLFEAGNEVGLEILYRGNFWPRVVKNLDGLLKYLQTTDKWAPIQQALFKRQEQAGGRELTEAEKSQVINTLLRGFRVGGVSLSRPGGAKERTIDVFDENIEPYYHNLADGLQIYIQRMTQAIGAREFFGKQTREIQNLRANKSRLATRLHKTSKRIGYRKTWTEEKYKTHISEAGKKLLEVTAELEKRKGQTLEDSVGWYVKDLVLAGKITPQQQIEMAQMFRAIFEPRGMSGGFRTFAKLAYIDTLANPSVAMTQLEELGLSVYKSKIRSLPAAYRAALGKSEVPLSEIGVTEINQYMGDLGFEELGTKLLFMMRGTDFYGKQTFVNTAVKVFRAEAKKKNLKADFVNKMRKMFGDEHKQVIDDLKNDRVTENVKFMAFNELADFQPIAITETPEYYARGGNARILYMLRSFTLRRFDFLRNKARKMMVNPAKKPKQFVKGLADMVQLLTILTAFGVGKDVLRNWFLGKPIDDLGDMVVDNILQYVLLSRYTAERTGREGLGSSVAQEIAPPTKFIDALIRDVRKGEIDRTVRSIPLIGENYYWWFGGGSEAKESTESTW